MKCFFLFHQSGTLLNLYQRQCLTVDRDAPPGLHQEVWVTQVEGSGNHTTGAVTAIDTVVILLNKGRSQSLMSVTWDILGLPRDQKYSVRDLWVHENYPAPVVNELKAIVSSHGVAMLRLSAAVTL